MRNLEKRLRALEASTNTVAEPVTLYFGDGTTQELRGRPGFVVGLLSSIFHAAAPGSEPVVELDLIRRSLSSKEPYGAHMIDLIRALLNGPAEQATGLSETMQKETEPRKTE